jgi:Kef-type K+ transport system membrane component KefB
MQPLLLNVPLVAETESFFPLLLVVALAFAVPIIISQIHRWLALPVVVGEILLGIVLGQIYPELAEDPILRILAEIGFGVLFFLAGTEIDFKSLRLPRFGEQPENGWLTLLKAPLILGSILFLLTLGLSAVAAYGMSHLNILRDSSWPFLVLIMAPSSLGLIVTVLKERGYTNSAVGQMILVAATVADFGTLLILTIAVAIIDLGGLEPQVFLVGLVFVGFIVAYLAFNRIYQQESVQRIFSAINSPTSQVKLRFAFSLFLLFVVLAETLGAEIVLGTFLAGVLVSLLATPRDRDVVHQVESVGFGFFIPIFFIMVGVRFDVDALLADPTALLLVPILIVVAILVKLLPALLFRLIMDWRAAIGSGLLLTARLSLIVAVAAIGTELESISSAVNADIILLAMVMAAVGPLAFNRIMPVLREEAPPPILVAGAGELGLEVAEQLRAHYETVLVVDPDPRRVQAARDLGFEAVEAFADRSNAALGDILYRVNRMVTTFADTDVNYQVCRVAKEDYGVEHVVAQVNNTGELERFQRLGVTAVNPVVDFSALMVMLTRNPAAYGLMTRQDDDKEIQEFVVRNPHVIDRRIRDLDLPAGTLLLALQRGGELMVPTADTRLRRDDHVTLVGKVDVMAHAYAIFSSIIPETA